MKAEQKKLEQAKLYLAKLEKEEREWEEKVNELKIENDFLKGIASKARALIYLFGSDGFSWQNHKVNIHGYRLSEIADKGRKWLEEQVYPEDLEIFKSNMKKLASEGETAIIYRVLHKNGSYQWCYSSFCTNKNTQNPSKDLYIGADVELTKTLISKKQVDALRQQVAQYKYCLYLRLLTCREKEILSMLGDGLTSKNIAEILQISLHTVDTHRKNILEKLELNNVGELAGFAVECGFTKSPEIIDRGD